MSLIKIRDNSGPKIEPLHVGFKINFYLYGVFHALLLLSFTRMMTS